MRTSLPSRRRIKCRIIWCSTLPNSIIMDSYPLHKGYLTKSPPGTRYTGRIKSWRRRWFVLYRNKSLQYYEDRGGEKKLIKTIDLNLCTCLDSNLSHKRFDNIFSIVINGQKNGKSIKRTYFLVADTPYEMSQWIGHICKVCEFLKDGTVVDISQPENKSQETSTPNHSDESRNVDEHCPVSISELMTSGSRDSGIHVSPSEKNNNSDLVSVSPPTQTASAYDIVPAPRRGGHESEFAVKGSEWENDIQPAPVTTIPNYDFVPPPVKAVSRRSPHYVSPRGTLDMSSSSEPEPDYDVPPSNQPSLQYDDIPPPVPKHTSKQSGGGQYDVPQSTNKGSFRDTDQPNYDVPPAHSTYDNVPPPLPIDKGIEQIDIYDVPPQVPNKPLHYQTPSNTSYNSVPYLRQRSLSESSIAENYDIVPPPVQASNYDYVPRRNENVDFDDTLDSSLDSSYDVLAPPIHRTCKPGKAYVNLTYVVKDTDVYDKPLPIVPGMVNSERDSGTVADFVSVSDETYDVPSKHGAPSNQMCQGEYAPRIDRSSKPIEQNTPPTVNRSSKPDESKSYVNLPKSSTFREFDRKVTKSNLLRSKSAVCDEKAEGYLYMESPKRTESSSRFSKKERVSSDILSEDDENISYEYMDSSNTRSSVPYENFNPQDLKQSLPKPETSDKRLKGHYQDIDIVCQRETPTVPGRQRNTNYTTIDLEKTKGFRKTCDDLDKGQ